MLLMQMDATQTNGANKMTEQYRINYATQEIHEIDEDGDAYIFLCSFYEIGATSKNRESTIIRKIENWK